VRIAERDGSTRELAPGYMDVNGLAWAPSGEIWFTGARHRGPFEIDAVDAGGNVRQVFQGPGRLVLHDIDRVGRALVTVDDLRASVVCHRAGTERDLSILDHTAVFDMSPDGDRLLLSEQSAAGRPSYDVYLRPSDGGPPLLLGEGFATSLSSDGRLVATLVNDLRDLVLLPTGTGAARRIARTEGQFHRAQIAGDRVVALEVVQGKRRFQLFSLDGTALGPVGPEGSWRDAVVAVDGKMLVASDADGGAWTIPFDGGAPRRIASLARHHKLADAPDDRHAYVLELAVRPARVLRLDLDSGELVEHRLLVPSDPAGFVEAGTFVASADGAHWAYTTVRQLSTLFVLEGLR
jgi:hypothetical protein